MIKNINPRGLSKHSVRKLTSPCKRADEIANDAQTTRINRPITTNHDYSLFGEINAGPIPDATSGNAKKIE